MWLLNSLVTKCFVFLLNSSSTYLYLISLRLPYSSYMSSVVVFSTESCGVVMLVELQHIEIVLSFLILLSDDYNQSVVAVNV